MKSWFLNNLELKLLSLILAAAAWWLIHTKISQPAEAATTAPKQPSVLK